MLEIKEYSYSYKTGQKVVKNLNLNLQEGDIYAFVGKNGAGKSTTIKSLVGIHPIQEGTILLDNVSIQKNPIKYKKQIAYIPEELSLYEHLTGRQYLYFISDIFEVSERQCNKRIGQYSKILELNNRLDDFIYSYSHGMKQKLALLSCFIHDPKVYILDEPFSSLDPKAVFKVKEILKEEAKKGKIIFFSTHVLEVAEKICTKIAIIKNGKIIVDGKMEEIIKNKDLETIFMELEND